MGNDERLAWIDLEMTGLDTDNDTILEIATVVTDAELNVLAEGPELAIAHPLATLEAMDEWNRTQHGRSGLWRRVLEEGRGRGAHACLPRAGDPRGPFTDVRQLDLPGPALPAPLHARAGALVPLPQP